MKQKKVKPGETGPAPNKVEEDLSGLAALAEKAKKATDRATQMKKVRKVKKGGYFCVCGMPRRQCGIGPHEWREY